MIELVPILLQPTVEMIAMEVLPHLKLAALDHVRFVTYI